MATRDAELKVLNEKLVDCEKQMKDDQNAFKEGYRKVSLYITYGIILMGLHTVL